MCCSKCFDEMERLKVLFFTICWRTHELSMVAPEISPMTQVSEVACSRFTKETCRKIPLSKPSRKSRKRREWCLLKRWPQWLISAAIVQSESGRDFRNYPHINLHTAFYYTLETRMFWNYSTWSYCQTMSGTDALQLFIYLFLLQPVITQPDT